LEHSIEGNKVEKMMPKSDTDSRREMAKYGREEEAEIAALNKFMWQNGAGLSKI
jgi:hypothetical protein